MKYAELRRLIAELLDRKLEVERTVAYVERRVPVEPTSS